MRLLGRIWFPSAIWVASSCIVLQTASQALVSHILEILSPVIKMSPLSSAILGPYSFPAGLILTLWSHSSISPLHHPFPYPSSAFLVDALPPCWPGSSLIVAASLPAASLHRSSYPTPPWIQLRTPSPLLPLNPRRIFICHRNRAGRRPQWSYRSWEVIVVSSMEFQRSEGRGLQVCRQA